MLYEEFYSELGKLLYAVADIDKVITSEEKRKLQEIVRGELVLQEVHHDGFGTDAGWYTEIQFDYLDEVIGDTDAAFNSFIYFVEEHHTAFDEKMKRLSLQVAQELANAYRKINKKEKALLNELKNRIERIDVKARA
jgi:hypothetical protein